jgi:hypothetical protein
MSMVFGNDAHVLVIKLWFQERERQEFCVSRNLDVLGCGQVDLDFSTGLDRLADDPPYLLLLASNEGGVLLFG